MNELEQLLALLGVNTYAEGAAAITVFNSFLTEAQSTTGKSKSTEVLAELSARASRSPFALAVEKACGKQGDEAIGLIHAALASHAELPNVQAECAKLRKEGDANALNGLIAKAKDEKRLTPAMETKVREMLAAGDLTLKGAESLLGNLTPVAALAAPIAAPAPANTAPATLTWNDKTFADLKPAQRAQLKREDPQLYEAMRASSN